MGLFKQVKKPVIKTAAAGTDISPLRPRYMEKAPPCAGGCPSGTDIRSWLTTIAQAEAYGRAPAEAYRIAWEKITEKNPFRRCAAESARIPARTPATGPLKTAPWPSTRMERYVGDFGIVNELKLSRLTTGSETRESGGGRRRSGRTLLCVPTGAARLPGYGIRRFQPARRHAALRYSGIPPAARSAGCGDRSAFWNSASSWSAIRRSGRRCRSSSCAQRIRRCSSASVRIGALALSIPGEDAPNVLSGTEFLNRANSGEPVDLAARCS